MVTLEEARRFREAAGLPLEWVTTTDEPDLPLSLIELTRRVLSVVNENYPEVILEPDTLGESIYGLRRERF